ncbi:uncharacterized protein LOC116255781 isoform X2 [Nymphaea colorata]|nr:uncharacterized protein LOC116255781 isoform X2 [Nymphaea colorata]
MQSDKGKFIRLSESMDSEEIKCAKGDHPPIECNSIKAAFGLTKTDAPMDNVVTVLPGSVKILAPEFERSFISAPCAKEEVNPEQLVVGTSTDVEKPLGQGQGIEHDDAKKLSSSGSELAVREENDRFLKQSASKSASLICNQRKLHLFPEGDSTKKFSHTSECQKYIAIEDDMNDFQKFISACDYLQVIPKSESKTNSDDLDAVTSRPAKGSSSNSLPDIKEPLLIKNNEGACLEACLDNFGGPSAEEDDNNDILNTGKYKGTKVSQENGSHESVEGSDNVQSVSTGKRKCSFTDGMRSSKIQKLNAGTTSCSESFLKKGSSFMKWISNVMKGLSEFNLDRKFLSENSSRRLNDDHVNLDSLCMLEETDQDADMCRNRSFQNFFHSMYCKNLRLHAENIENSECVMEAKESWKVGETSRRPFGEGCSYTASGKNTELPYQPNLSKLDERSGSPIGGNSSWLLTLPSLDNGIAVSKEKYKDKIGGKSCSYNIACGFEKTGINLPRASSVKGSGSITNVMLQPMPDVIEGGKPSETSNKKVTEKNLWIARLSPSCSAPSLKPLNDGKGVYCANEALALVDQGVSSIHNNVDAAMKLKMLEASQPPSRRSMDCCISSMDMPCSKRNENFKLEKLPTKLPSQRFILPFLRSANISDSPANDEEISNNADMIFSRNVKDLDIHKQTITVSTARETHTLLCFFCGSVDHSIRKCSEIAKCKLEYPLTNIIACDSDEESSYFCIRCFQLGHWAMSCPLLSSPADCTGLVRLSCEKAGALLDHDRKHSTQPKTIDNDYWFNKEKTKVADNDQAAVGNPRLERSQSAPSSGCLESKPNQIIPFFGPHGGKVPSLPHAMFERIRRLQLSRSDIVRWMKVPQLNLHLKGFFLRVRFRKWEERLGGGYCVACISGVTQEREHGRNKIQLLVNLGGFSCLVDYCYISNHEFTEEEVMEWWFSTLSGDANVPSEEDFRLKIEEKKKLNISCPE